MVSIKALIASTLFASVLGKPVANFNEECTIYATWHNDDVNILRFDDTFLKYGATDGPVTIIGDDLGDKGGFQLLATFDKDIPSVVNRLTLWHFFNETSGYVTALDNDFQDLVKILDLDGKETVTNTQGTFSALDGLVKYTVENSMQTVKITFVVNDDIVIDTLVGEPNEHGTPVLKVRQSSKYQQSAHYKPFGLCAN